MSKHFIVSTSLSEDQQDELDSLVVETGKSVSMILREALLFSMEHEDEFVNTLEGIKPAPRGPKKKIEEEKGCPYTGCTIESEPDCRINLEKGSIMVHSECYTKNEYQLPAGYK